MTHWSIEGFDLVPAAPLVTEVDATAAIPIAAQLSGVGGLSVSTTLIEAALPGSEAGAGTVAASGILIASASTLLAGVGGVSANAEPMADEWPVNAIDLITRSPLLTEPVLSEYVIAEALLAGVGNLSVASAPTIAGVPAAVLGVGSLVVTAKLLEVARPTSLNGVGSLVVEAVSGGHVHWPLGAVDLVGNVPQLTEPEIHPIVSAAALLAGAGGFSAAARLLKPVVPALMSGVGHVYATGQVSWLLEADDLVALSPRLSEPVFGAQSITQHWSGVGGLACTATLIERATVGILVGAGTLRGDIERLGELQAQAKLAGVGAISVAARGLEVAAANLAGIGSLAAQAQGRGPVSARFDAVGQLSANASVMRVSSALLDGAGNLTASVLAIEIAAAILAGSGTVACNAAVQKAGVSYFGGIGSFSGDVSLTLQARADLLGFGTLASQLLVVGQIESEIGGIGRVDADVDLITFATSTLDGCGALNVEIQQIVRTDHLFDNVRKIYVNGNAAPIAYANARARNARVVSGGRR